LLIYVGSIKSQIDWASAISDKGFIDELFENFGLSTFIGSVCSCHHGIPHQSQVTVCTAGSS